MSQTTALTAAGLVKRYHPTLTFLRFLLTPFRYAWRGVRSLLGAVPRPPELQDVSFSVRPGAVVGFLGPNGSGKTTTIKLLTRLLRPDGGRIEILGQALATEDPQLLGRLGCAVGEPCFYSYLTGRENLEFLASLRGLPADGQVDELLRDVALAGRDKKFSDYSSGMRRRLALAHALLGRPELLILDEPSSGLDPRGRVELRQLIRRINRERGVTVFISSHELKELEDICDYLVIIEKGRVSLAGDVGSLRGALAESADRTNARVQMTPSPENESFLAGLPYVDEVSALEDGYALRLAREGLVRLPGDFVAAGRQMSGYFETRESIEDIYLRATKEDA